MPNSVAGRVAGPGGAMVRRVPWEVGGKDGCAKTIRRGRELVKMAEGVSLFRPTILRGGLKALQAQAPHARIATSFY